MTSSIGQILNMCYEGTGRDEADPFKGSYLEVGDRVIEIDEEEDEEEIDYIGDQKEGRDFSCMETIEFEE